MGTTTTKETIQKRILELIEVARVNRDNDKLRIAALSEIIFLRELLVDKKEI